MMLELTPIRAKPKGAIYPFVYDASDAVHNWDAIEPFVEASVRVSFGMITTGIIREMLAQGQAVCMGIAKDEAPLAILVVRIVEYPDHRSARIIAAAGRELKEAMKFLHILETWAHTLGAIELEAWCRPSMTRLVKQLGWKPRLTMLTFDLRRTLQ